MQRLGLGHTFRGLSQTRVLQGSVAAQLLGGCRLSTAGALPPSYLDFSLSNAAVGCAARCAVFRFDVSKPALISCRFLSLPIFDSSAQEEGASGAGCVRASSRQRPRRSL